METTMTPTMEIRTLEAEHRCLNDFYVDYTLYRVITPHTSYYAVEIHTAEECEMQIVGQDCSHAQRVFEMLYNETVTPCTLIEVLHDILMSEEERFHRQNLS